MSKKLFTKDRRKEIRQLIETTGLIHINKSELGRKYGVSDVTIHNDLNKIVKSAKPEDVKLLLKKFDQAFNTALKGSLRAFSDASTTKETIDAVKAISSVTSDYLGSLSKLGYNIDVPTDDSHLFTIESFRKMVLKKAEQEKKSAWNVLKELLDIPIRADLEYFKKWLYIHEPTEKDLKYIEDKYVNWEGNVSKVPNKPVKIDSILKREGVASEEDDLEEIVEGEDEDTNK